MATEDDLTVCNLRKRGRLSNSLKELNLRQLSDKGYVHFRVTVAVNICDSCGDESLGAGAEQILDEAFRREYDKLP
jgi:hypothetical protein